MSADLQRVHGFRCYDNIALNAKCQQVLVLGLCLFVVISWLLWYSVDWVSVHNGIQSGTKKVF